MYLRINIPIIDGKELSLAINRTCAQYLMDTGDSKKGRNGTLCPIHY
jgi:hypothetical protein